MNRLFSLLNPFDIRYGIFFVENEEDKFIIKADISNENLIVDILTNNNCIVLDIDYEDRITETAVMIYVLLN